MINHQVGNLKQLLTEFEPANLLNAVLYQMLLSYELIDLLVYPLTYLLKIHIYLFTIVEILESLNISIPFLFLFVEIHLFMFGF